mmetsp:Transcript_74121/g.143414  ORF Transcript_74121/g.143414 Transcript_74121/m.143414 type:complete len:478 (+) Transcript_74121:60-1493(+)
MGKKIELKLDVAAKGVKKHHNGKAVQQTPIVKVAKVAQSVVPKDASDFLKQRLGKKLRHLRTRTSDVDAQNGNNGDDVAALQLQAERRGGEFEQDCGGAEDDNLLDIHVAGKTNPGREAENTRKRFYVELRKVLAAADVIVEVLDARDPGSCRSMELERTVSGSGKRLVLLVNKIDLVPKHALESWMNHLRRSFPVIAFKAAQGGANRPVHAMTNAGRATEGLLRSAHAVVGADELMQLLKNYSRTGGTKTKAHLHVGIVGYPNTGKSSVINSMKRHAAVQTGGRAGVTKTMQEVLLDRMITLIDSPGVVFEGKSDDPSVVLRNVVTVDGVQDPVGVVEAMLAKAPREAFLQFYGLEADFQRPHDFLCHVARTRGKLKRGGGLDLDSAARSVISDWTSGKFRYFVMPPAADALTTKAAEAEVTEVVSSLAPRLDIDALFGNGGDEPVVLGVPPSLQSKTVGSTSMDVSENTMVDVDM